MDELAQVEMLNNDLMLFNREFNNLKDFYKFNDEKEIKNFVKLHPGIIILLNAYEMALKKYFSNALFELEFDPDTSGTWFDLIVLNVWLDEETFNNGSMEYICSIDRELRPLRTKLDLLGEVVLTKRILR